MDDLLTYHLSVGGRVQGVGYRDGLRLEAERLGVTGWVRNRADGTVEAVIQGRREALEALVQWARTGPPTAIVSGLTVRNAAGLLPRDHSGFKRLPTT
ncbi:MAG: acylphosphatase [Burkholderiales bacterium]